MKQQQLIFDKGITNTPSDTICSDNALQECLNLYYREGEHRPIQSAELYMSGAPQILYVHKYSNTERFITWDNINNIVQWGTREYDETTDSYIYQPATNGDLVISAAPNVSSIGKTLIVSTETGIYYFLWNDDVYKHLGQSLPEIDISYELSINSDYQSHFVHNSSSFEGIFHTNGYQISLDYDGAQEKYNDLVIGLYSKNKKEHAKECRFVNPFFVRAALELYDGTFAMITNPVLMMPSITDNSYSVFSDGWQYTVYTRGATLSFKQSTDYSDWSDIVKDIVLFVTDEIEIYDTTSDLRVDFTFGGDAYRHVDGIVLFHNDTTGLVTERHIYQRYSPASSSSYTYNPFNSQPLLYLANIDEVAKKIKGMSVFYQLCGIGVRPVDTLTDVKTKTNKNTLLNITTQTQLEKDDYFNHAIMVANFIYTYNSRLCITNVSRGFFEGFDNFMPWDNANNTEYDYTFLVTIKTDAGNKIIRHAAHTKQMQGAWFYYPDARASHVVIYKVVGTTIYKVLDEDLEEHQALNGAFYLHDLSWIMANVQSDVHSNTPTVESIPDDDDNDDTEMLPNYIIQSEVNNPFVFPASGYHKVGMGRILAMSSQTYALSEGQYGQFPILVFTDEGIWAANTGSDGAIVSTTPMSREVCNSPHTITQTDGPVFFLSDKGLMMIAGKSVECMSRQLSGREDDASNRLDIVNIAFDYRDSLLWLFTESGGNRCFIYNIPTGTFSRNTISARLSPKRIYNVVNMYPDTLLQYTSGEVHSLLTRVNINDDENTYTATIKTRPMKLENGLALKSILQMRHICQFADEGSLSLRIFASNNLRSWVELKSLHGTPWKYYRFEYTFNGLKATDTFAGTMLITDERRSLRLR